MKAAEIERELPGLQPEELRRIALMSWAAFVQREGRSALLHTCDEDDSELLAALDSAVTRADAAPEAGHTATELRRQLPGWITG
jgi:hypothetical protein